MSDIANFVLAVSAILFVITCSGLTPTVNAEVVSTGRRKPGGQTRLIAAHKKPSTTPSPTPTPKSVTKIVRKLQDDYKRDDPPMKDRPTEVRLGIYIMSVSSISEQTMDYRMSMYFRQAWRDPRLSFEAIGTKTTILLPDGSWKKFWVPDTYFRNEKKAAFHDVTVSNRMLKLNTTGHMWYVIRITATLSCQMILHKFPLDVQTCPILFESFGYKMDTVYFGWIEPAVDKPPKLEIPQFTLVKWISSDCSTNYTTGSYACSEIRFVLRRDIGYFVIQIFVPSILTVIMSWVSFWINIDGVPARVSLGLLTVLTVTTAGSTINASLPKVSYIKAIDVWMIVCLLFVFCALLEYAFVNVAARNSVRIRTPIVRQASLRAALENADLIAPRERGRSSNVSLLATWWRAIQERIRGSGVVYKSTIDVEGSKRRARNIDRFSRKTFPLAFVIFNIIYWIVYSVPSQSAPHDPSDQSETQ